MIRIQEDRKAEFLPQAIHEGGELPGSYELPLALSCVHKDRYIQLPGSSNHSF
jgi:hypothetical protein